MDRKMAPSLQAAYDKQYDDEVAEWRRLGGVYKADNILYVCRGRHFERVLDCGAGEGAVAAALCERGAFGELHAAEISGSGIERLGRVRGLAGVHEFDGYSLPFEEGFFDMAYCSHVIEHVEHPRLLLRELRRVSRFQVFEVPLDYRIGVDAHVEDQLRIGHIDVYTPTTFSYLLRTEGFEILCERRTQLSPKVLRYAWYRNEGLPWSMRREARLLLRPLLERVRRLRMGARAYDEYAYDAYTCLARGSGELRILDDV